MNGKRWTDEQKAEALLILAEVGCAEASRQTGIPGGTIACWGSRSGVRAPTTEQLRPAMEAHVRSNDERKATLATNLLGDVERMRTQLFAPCTQRVVRTVGRESEIVDVELDEPGPADKRALANAMATLIDKIQLLQGQAPGKEDGMAGPKAQILNEARERALRLVS